MKQTLTITGMTCGSCVANVSKALSSVPGVRGVDVELAAGQATIDAALPIPSGVLQQALADRYKITSSSSAARAGTASVSSEPTSKWRQLRPLFIIIIYISVASLLLHRHDWDLTAMMLDFMGLFYIVFSFFKMLDVKGFAASFAMYDPLAAQVPVYGRIYPFLETTLGLMLLLRWQVTPALIATIVILGLTTYGVVGTLMAKRQIKCACLGTALDLPMTEATFIENALMITMAIVMLVWM